jgi:DNA mismatch repair protein MutS2
VKNEIVDNFLRAIEYPELLAELASHCQTPAGRDFLKAFDLLADQSVIESRLSKTRELEKHLLKLGNPTVPDSQDFIEAFEKARSKGEVFSGKELASLVKFLFAVVRLRQYLTPEGEVPAVFQEWLGRMPPLPELQEKLKAVVSDRGEVLDSASPELKSARDQLRALKAEVQDFYQSFLQKDGSADALQEKIVTEREGRLVVPVKRDRQSQVPGFVHGISSSGSTLFVEPGEIVESNNRIKEALLREDEEVRKILRETTQAVLASGDPLESVLIACAEVDAHGVLALFASRYDGQFLQPQAGPGLSLKGARHPLLALENREQFREKVIPLDVEFKDDVKVILVSGPNAGGKTVALKTIGLTCAMAQAGLPVLARGESAIPRLSHFDTDLEDGQSLSDHLSTYAAKLKALKRMMDHCGPETLFLLDELGAGTDPREGGALGIACLEAFLEKGATVMANTHQPLLKLLTQEEKGMANAAMLFDEKTGKPTFQMVSGIPGQSYALTLARQFGFSEEILEKAKAHLPQGEADLSEMLAKLGQEKQAAQAARQEAEKARENARKLEQELLTARRQMKDEARRIKKDAQIEAEGMLKNTRRKMEHLIQGVETPAGKVINPERINAVKREVNQKLRNIKPAPAKVIVEVGELKEGDAVFFKPGQCDVKILSADEEKGEAVILMENGMKLSCKYSDLGRVTAAPKPVARPQVAGVMSAKALDEKGKLELDLRGKMVDQALPALDKFLDDALLVNLPFVRIIHGKGTGALKEAIHKHLPSAHPDVEFTMAEPAQGGAGVTVIKFKK